MSHFLTLVIVPEEDENAVAELLAPFSENLSVPAYQRECYCRGSKARIEVAQKYGPRYEAFRKAFWSKPVEERTDEAWKALTAETSKEEAAEEAAHPLKDAVDPYCSECGGTGTFASNRNPQSKWDYWTIGAWAEFPAVCEVIELPDKTPFAILLPTGEWLERGKMGWWAMVSNEKDQNTWENIVKDVFKKYSDHFAYAVDCHI